jgi:transcriptional regulator
MSNCCRTEKSHTYKERRAVGKRIAAALPQLMSQREVARQLGISQQAVSLIEQQALAKVSEAVLRMANEL